MLLTVQLMGCSKADSNSEDTTSTVSQTTAPEETTVDQHPDTLPNDIDYDGMEMTLTVGDLNGTVYNTLNQEEETGNRVEDSVYTTTKNVQERLNLVFKWDVMEVTTGTQQKHPTMVASRILAGDRMDLYFGVLDFTSLMTEDRYFENLYDTEYFNIDQPWFRQSVAEALPDYLFTIAGDFSIYNVRNVMCMYFNDDLYKSFGKTEDLYELVDGGEWTLYKMEEIIKNTYLDLNGDGTADSGDSYGLTFGDCNKYTGFIPALGVRIFTKTADSFVFTFDSERAVNAMTELNRIVNENIEVLPANLTMTVILSGRLPLPAEAM